MEVKGPGVSALVGSEFDLPKNFVQRCAQPIAAFGIPIFDGVNVGRFSAGVIANVERNYMEPGGSQIFDVTVGQFGQTKRTGVVVLKQDVLGRFCFNLGFTGTLQFPLQQFV